MLNTKTVEVTNFIPVRKESNPIRTKICIFIKVYHISPILNFFRQIFSRINVVKSWFILVIPLYFKVCQRTRRHQKFRSCPYAAHAILFPFLIPEPAHAIPFPANIFPNKLAPKVPNNILKNPTFCSFVSLFVTPFNKILESSRG